MPQVLIPSLIGALTGTFAVGSTFAGMAITGFWGSVAANLAVNIAAGYALNALAPKAKAGAAGAGYASVNALSPAAAIVGNLVGFPYDKTSSVYFVFGVGNIITR